MMKEGWSVRTLGWVLALSLILLAASCGGGGGGGDGDSDQFSGTPATMDQTTARQTMGVVQFGTAVGELYGETGLRFAAGASGNNALFAQSMIATVLQLTEQKLIASDQRAGSGTETEDCPYGGSITVSGSWTGPNIPSDCSDIVNLNATISMNSCSVDSGSTMNGSATISITGSACAPSAISISFHNIAFTSTYDEVSIQIDDLDISLTGITWSANQSYVTHGRMVIDGDASGTVEGVAYQARYHNFTEVMDTPDNYSFSVRYSGYVSGGCMDGWVSIETLQAIAFTSYDECPSAGQVRLSGDIDLLVTINPNGTITAGDTDYADCSEFEMPCTP